MSISGVVDHHPLDSLSSGLPRHRSQGLNSAMPSNAHALIKTLNALSDSGAIEDDASVRMEALRMSRELCHVLQDPGHSAIELAFAPFVSMSARAALELDLFALIDENDGPITASQLAHHSGAEEVLISRLLRSMTAYGFVKEVGEHLYSATPTTRAMASPPALPTYRFLWDSVLRPSTPVSDLLSPSSKHCLTINTNGVNQHHHNLPTPSLSSLLSQPRLYTDYRAFMNLLNTSHSSWVNWYPVEERLLVESQSTAPLVVDIGSGGSLRDLQAFHSKFPGMGHLVLQDVPEVTEEIRTMPRAVEKVSWDMKSAQPVKGARAYHLSHILHIHPDSTAHNILTHLHEAMAPGYSKVLLHELVIPDTGASTMQATLDMAVMTFNSGRERTKREWEALLEAAGFDIMDFWKGDDDHGIWEAMVRQ